MCRPSLLCLSLLGLAIFGWGCAGDETTCEDGSPPDACGNCLCCEDETP